MSIRDDSSRMPANPYATPTPVENKTEPERTAERRIAPVAMGLQAAGVISFLMGLFGVTGLVFGAFMWWRIHTKFGPEAAPPVRLIDEGLPMVGGTLACLLVGFLSFYAGRRLRRLDSMRWAYAACTLGLVFYPLCVVTLPLGIYGFFVLRRADVKAVISQRQADRNIGKV